MRSGLPNGEVDCKCDVADDPEVLDEGVGDFRVVHQNIEGLHDFT